MANNSYVTTTDPVHHHIFDSDEVELYFGKDFLEESGMELDPELIRRYKAASTHFWDVQKEIKNALKRMEK